MLAQEKTETRKEEIFRAAAACFNEHGYYGTSMDMISERAGITKRGLYYHFKSKDELFIKLFHFMNEQYYSQIPAYAAHITDPEERLLLFVDIARRMVTEHSDFLKFSQEFMAIGVRKPEIREVMTLYYREQVGKVQRLLEQGIEQGAFISVDAEKMARAIVLMTMGTFHVYFSLDPDFDLTEQHEFDVRQFIGCLKKGSYTRDT